MAVLAIELHPLAQARLTPVRRPVKRWAERAWAAGHKPDHIGDTMRPSQAKTVTYPFRSLAEATPDQVIDAWVAEGLIEITDMTFDAFSKRVIAAHEAEFARLYERYIGKIG